MAVDPKLAGRLARGRLICRERPPGPKLGFCWRTWPRARAPARWAQAHLRRRRIRERLAERKADDAGAGRLRRQSLTCQAQDAATTPATQTAGAPGGGSSSSSRRRRSGRLHGLIRRARLRGVDGGRAPVHRDESWSKRRRAARMSSTGTTAPLPSCLSAGAPSTAWESEAHAARMARFSSKLIPGRFTTSSGWWMVSSSPLWCPYAEAASACTLAGFISSSPQERPPSPGPGTDNQALRKAQAALS